MANDAATAPAPEAPSTLQANPAEAYQKLLAKYDNNAGELALKLFGENYELREKNRELAKRVPTDGAKVLTADEAARFQAFTELGVEPQEIKASLAKIPELEKTAKELSQMENIREASALHGYKPGALKKLMADFPDATFEFKTEKDKDGKEAKVAFIRNGDKESPLTEFAEANFDADLLPALKAAAEPPQIKTGNSADPPPALGSAESPADKHAMAAQARATHSHF